MSSYALKLAGGAIAILVAGIVGIVIFTNIWARVGLGAALVFVCGGLLLFAWNVDRKDKAKRGASKSFLASRRRWLLRSPAGDLRRPHQVAVLEVGGGRSR